jgi:hypothetical protein
VNNLFFLLIFFSSIISACTPIHIEKPPPSPQSIQIEISRVLLSTLKNDLYGCAEKNSGIVINHNILDSPIPEKLNADLRIILGEPRIGGWEFIYQLGFEEIVIITNIDSNLKQGYLDSIQEIFTAENPDRVVLSYPKGDIVRTIFKGVILGDQEITPSALVVTSPNQMMQNIKQNKDAIGYIPGSLVTNDVKVISLEPDIEETLKQPILGLTVQEPDGYLKIYLDCLQNLWILESEKN